VDNAGAGLVVLLLGDPHLLEGGEGGQDGATDPDRVLPLWWGNDLDLDGGWGKSSDLLLHTVSNTGVHGGASGHDSVGVQVLPDVNIALHDGVVDSFMNTARFHSEEGWLEERLRATESFIANGDDLTIGKLIRLLKGGRGSGSGHFLFKVKSNIAKLLLDVADNFTLSSGGERVATFSEDLHQVISEVSASKIKTENSMGKSISFIDGDSVRDTISRVKDNAGGSSRCIEGEDSLDGDIHGRRVEGLKHDLGHLLTVSFGVEWSLGKEDRLFLRGNTELIEEGVVPDLLHVVPVGDDSMFNWVLKGEDTSLGLSLISNIGILLTHTHHHTLMSRATNNAWEDSSGGVITSKASFAHSRAIVNHQSGNIFVTHFDSYSKLHTFSIKQ